MSAVDADWLKDKQVAFTGKLASMTRAEACSLVKAYGGIFVTSVSKHTAFLVVGQEGLPLTRKGGLTGKLNKAKRLQWSGSPVILPEEDFFDRLGLAPRSGGVHRLYTTAQLCRLLRVPRDRVRAWIREGLLKPVETVHGVCFFDFQQVTAVKTLADLAESGVKSAQIRRSLEMLGQWMPHVEEPLAHLSLIDSNGQLLFRLAGGQLAEPSGQMQFDFTGDEADAVIVDQTATLPSPETAQQWWELGCDHEEAGRLREAAQAYRRALLVGGPNATTSFNLGNVLYALNKKGPAAERFRQAVESDPAFAEAWNNLGNVLADLQEFDEALLSYRRALELNPAYADVHYNLADTLEQIERPDEARKHWQTYVRLEPMGPWADYARRRLNRS